MSNNLAQDNEKKAIKRGYAYFIGLIPIFMVVYIIFSLCVQLSGRSKALEVLNSLEQDKNVIFAETQSGALMYIPINDKEAVMEASADTGESLYLWLETGQTVTITDDIMVTKQVNFYDMLRAVINRSATKDIKLNASHLDINNNDRTYIFTIKNVKNVLDLMTNGWQLSDGQTAGSLSCYDGSLNKDMSMELIIKTEGENTYFKLNLFVENTGYCIYNGRFLKQNAERLPQFEVDLYNLNGINTISPVQERVDDYAHKAIDYFYKLSTCLDIENFENLETNIN